MTEFTNETVEEKVKEHVENNEENGGDDVVVILAKEIDEKEKEGSSVLKILGGIGLLAGAIGLGYAGYKVFTGNKTVEEK